MAADRAEEPAELNVRLLAGEDRQMNAKLAAQSLSQSVFDESSPYSRRRQARAALLVTLGCFLNGGAVGYTGPALPHLTGGNATDIYGNGILVSSQSASWITGLLFLGAIIGVAITTVMMDKIGRRRTLLMFTAPCYLVGYALIIGAFTEYLIWAGRFVCGIAFGSDLVVATVYIVEISKRDVRGALGFLVQLMASLGILYTFGVGYFLDWKWLAVANVAWVVPFVVGVLAVPESPRWLVFKGRQYSASRSLGWLRGRGKPTDIEKEIEMIKLDIEEESKRRSGLNTLAPHWRPLLISLALMFFLNFSGIHVLICYATEVFSEASGRSPGLDPRISTVVVGAATFLSCLASIPVVARLKNHLRHLIVWSVLGMGLAQLALAMCFLYVERWEADVASTLVKAGGSDNATAKAIVELADPIPLHVRWFPLFAVLGFLFVGNVGYGTLIWVVTSRILPARIHGVGRGVVVAFSFACAFVVAKSYVDLVDGLGNSGAFFVYAGICFLGFLFSFLFLPQTHNRDSEERATDDCLTLMKRNVSFRAGFRSRAAAGEIKAVPT